LGAIQPRSADGVGFLPADRVWSASGACLREVGGWDRHPAVHRSWQFLNAAKPDFKLSLMPPGKTWAQGIFGSRREAKMSVVDNLRTADRQVIAVQALLTARRHHLAARRSKTERNGSRGPLMRARQS
jgi:hypothetical protein